MKQEPSSGMMASPPLQSHSRPQETEIHASEEGVNPLYILAGICLGIPALAMVLLLGTNPGVQDGTLTTLTMFIVLSAFGVAAIFEIKRLADQPSGKDRS